MSSKPEPPSANAFASLLAESRAGSDEAKGRLLQLFEDRLQAAAGTLLSPKASVRKLPDDFAQETLLRAHEHFDEFHGKSEGEFHAWLRAILERVLLGELRYLRRRSHDASREVPLDTRVHGEGGKDVVAPETCALDELIEQERREQIEGCLLEQPPMYREVIRLRAMEGRNFKEIAVILGISAGAAQTRFVRASRRLRERLERKGIGPE